MADSNFAVWESLGTARYDRKFNKEAHPYFTQDKPDGDETATQYIANMRDGAVAGFKYFDIQDVSHLRVVVNGKGNGKLEVSADPAFTAIAASIPVKTEGVLVNATGSIQLPAGVQPLYFRFTGEGYMNFYSFELS